MTRRPIHYRAAPTALALLASTLAVGCGDLLKQPYPAKAYFAIEPALPEPPAAVDPLPDAAPDSYINRDANVVATTRPTHGGMMLVRAVRVVPPYDGLAFVYHDGPGQYATDYYNNFIAPPSALLTGGLTEWLDRAGPVPVSAGGSAVRPDLVLEGEVTHLEVDRTDHARPKALVAARFFLTREGGNGGLEILLDSSYSAAVPASPDTPAGYAQAWGKAWGQILRRLATDLKAAVQPR